MTNGRELPLQFPEVKGRKIEGDFDDGVLLVRQVDRWIGFTKRLAEVLADPRDLDRITHSLESLLPQRSYGLASATRTTTACATT